jgi:superfamily II DNA or RNA helicase
MPIVFDWDASRRQGKLSGEYFDEIREHFSVKNDAAKFARFRGRYMPSRSYVITPAGRFDIGLFNEINNFIIERQYNTEMVITPEFSKKAKPLFTESDVPQLKLALRQYQTDIVNSCTKNGRGVVVLATAGGKTLTIATLLESYYKNICKDFRCVLIVPDRGLVEQTINDFIDYEVSFSASKWTGDDNLDLSCNVIICNMGILQSSKSDTSWLLDVDMCVVDEVHKLRRGNKINKLFKQIRTSSIYGFTGTMPEDLIDQWNIIGKVGPVIYERNSYELRKDKYISDVKVQILRLEYIGTPNYPTTLKDPSERYRAELDFIIHNNFRNNILSSLCRRVDGNILLLVDYIEHGKVLHQHITQRAPDKRVYFIQGDVDLESRERIKQIMEMEDNIVVVAISKIFSTGINIKNLHYIVFGSGGKAKIKTIQSIGRGLRLHKNKSKLIIFDIGDDLQYGMKHLAKRICHYDKENIQYGTQTIKENDSQQDC